MQIYMHNFACEKMISPLDGRWDFYPYNEFDIEELCFFDIETTGLASATSNIYLIGAGYFDKEKKEFNVIQWFADDYDSEKEMLKRFVSFVDTRKVLMQYNGSSFDIPFIRAKCKRHKVDFGPIENKKHLDIYVALRKYAKPLGLENKKLKSFEKYIGIDREDMFDGGALIEVYVAYIHNKMMRKENEPMLKLLLLHNYEDIVGLSQVSVLLFLKELGGMHVRYEHAQFCNDGVIRLIYSGNFPYDCSFTLDGDIECRCLDSQIILKVPVRNDTLKYYFTDYKDYYYMIEEGNVIHKSVAVYTEPSVRRKAVKRECFVTKAGKFLPVKKPGCFSDKTHIFREDYTLKDYYIEMTDELLNDSAFFEKYFAQVFE
ncbi:MAG: ribonuclease H-like domain-containing protein [Lachnospiraceae bacterium]|nr:ribonuclease H-like domain-containing protein [Lachnospiraceae bacterium]